MVRLIPRIELKGDMQVIVLVPIYKHKLDALEQYSLDISLSALEGRVVRFIGPRELELSYYQCRYPTVPFIEYDPASFSSIQGYNRLLLDINFYQQFVEYEFILILQVDAVALRDELDYWCARPFDYIGAPWPDGVELLVNVDQFKNNNGHRIRAKVGNGGLSLRRTRKCISLLHEFPEATDYFLRSGSSEDLFFAFMGLVSSDFVLPNEITASLFSLELKPNDYFAINGNRLPMGGHAWWKYDLAFWQAYLPAPIPVINPL